MSQVVSAGLLVYRRNTGTVEVLLTHPGGPFWAKKDTWSIPKGEVEAAETPEAAAEREFYEETSLELSETSRLDLGEAAQGSHKINHIWAVEANPDLAAFKCTSTFVMEWPPRSGREQEFPENDRAAWFELASARRKVYKAQTVFIERLAEQLRVALPTADPEQQALL